MNISPKRECLADFVAAQAGLLRKVAKQAKRMGLEAWFRFFLCFFDETVFV